MTIQLRSSPYQATACHCVEGDREKRREALTLKKWAEELKRSCQSKEELEYKLKQLGLRPLN